MKVKCGWCREEIEIGTVQTKEGRRQIMCSICARLLKSSHKEYIKGSVKNQHFHIELESGDLV